MAFLYENEVERHCKQKITGTYLAAAVDCWFPSTGKFYPRMIKYQDENQMIQCIKDIQVLYSEQKYYAGVQARKFQCQAVVDGWKKEFILLFFPEDGTWNLIFPST